MNLDQFNRAVLQGLGIPVTSGALQALKGWARQEGGHFHNDARYNPFNTTQNMPGSGDTGTQGNISVYRSFQQGVQATIKTLNNGRYGPILAALRKGDPAAVGRAIDSSPWGTHNATSAILGTKAPAAGAGAGSVPTSDRGPGAGAGVRTTTVSTPGVDNRYARAQLIQSFLKQADRDPIAFATQARALADIPATSVTTRARAAGTPADTTPATGVISPHARPGDPVVSSKQSEGGVHQTSGLAGYPARDWFAPAGTHAVAPVSGRVIKLSGNDPSLGATQGAGGPLGWSTYIKGDDGKTYFLTHMGSRNVKVGQRVKQGQVIGTVANYDKYGRPSHIHQGVSG